MTDQDDADDDGHQAGSIGVRFSFFKGFHPQEAMCTPPMSSSALDDSSEQRSTAQWSEKKPQPDTA
jgi:hypothetical protein